MKKISVKDMLIACGGKLLCGSEDTYIEGACLDSRKVEKGDLFIAVKGENTDGHKFLKIAADKGAKCLLVSDEKADYPEKIAVILVKDTVDALADIAMHYRNSLNIKIIGVTGSVGKTSTSDIVRAVSSTKFKTQKTKGNFNNNLGLPLTLLSFDPDTEVGILEMGMDQLGEIDYLCSIAKPDIGIITNIGTAHIERLGSRENIFKAKMEIQERFGNGNTLIVCGDDDFLCNVSSCDYQVIKAGKDLANDFVISDICANGDFGIKFKICFDSVEKEMNLPVLGEHNAVNAGLAVAAGWCLGISFDEAAEGLESMVLTSGRLTVKENKGIRIIDDTYNASTASMIAGIDVLMSVEGKRKVAILADILEQGEFSKEEHIKVGEYAAAKKTDLLIAVGNDAEYIKEGAKGIKTYYFKTKEELFDVIDEIILPGDAVLCKGSRGMQMDKVVDRLMER